MINQTSHIFCAMDWASLPEDLEVAVVEVDKVVWGAVERGLGAIVSLWWALSGSERGIGDSRCLMGDIGASRAAVEARC